MANYTILFLILLISTILLRVLFKSRKPPLPPSPTALPIIGHLHLLAPIPHLALHKLSKRYGPLIHIFLGSVPCVVASSPEMAKEVLKTNESSFSNRPSVAAIDYINYGLQDFAFGPCGPYWKFMKKLCISELLGGRTLDLLHPVRRDEIQRFIKLLSKKATAGESVDVGGELIKLANNVISRMLMSKRCSENEDDASQIRKLMQEIKELPGKFNLFEYIWFCKCLSLQGFRKRLRNVRDNYHDMMERIIREHQEARRKWKESGGASDVVKDLLHILLDISEDQSSEMRLTQEDIKAFILCFEWKVGVGGNDTVDMEEGPGFTVPRAHSLVCVPMPRLNLFPSKLADLIH
ncbi:unnamed protein product [Ilex paraguariensis]|uniref:Uncharacterized protein n=1 Tax=Ilex paraguariensis TaxID=185542 RepID=A0ABC8SR32_9AQUA